MIDNTYALIVIVVMTVVTVALRALPFVGARSLQRFPQVERVGRFLPPAIMTLLLVVLENLPLENLQLELIVTIQEHSL